MSETELDSPNWLGDALDELKQRNFERINMPKDRNAADLQRARQILAASPAALVTVQTDGTLIIVTPQGSIEVSGDLKWRVE